MSDRSEYLARKCEYLAEVVEVRLGQTWETEFASPTVVLVTVKDEVYRVVVEPAGGQGSAGVA